MIDHTKLPPVNLYKVGGFYFVSDGHYCVSVARYHGIQVIDANVTEFHARLQKHQRQREAQPKR